MSRAALPGSAPITKPVGVPATRPKSAAIAIDPVRLLRQNARGIVLTLVLGAVLGVILNYVFFLILLKIL